MQTPQAGSSSSPLECVSELWPFRIPTNLPHVLQNCHSLLDVIVSSLHFIHLSIHLMYPFHCLSVFLYFVEYAVYKSLLMLHSDISRPCSQTFEQCSFASCKHQKLSKSFMWAPSMTHLFTYDRFPLTSSCTQSPLRWIALPLSSLPSLPVLLLTSHHALFSLPFLSEKRLLQSNLPDKCLLKVEELWWNAEVFSKYGRREWRLTNVGLFHGHHFPHLFHCIRYLLWAVGYPHVTTGLCTL